MIIHKRPGSEQWVFKGGKHMGETIEQVAVNDPSYVRWAWSQHDLTDEAFYALSDCMDKFNISRTRD